MTTIDLKSVSVRGVFNYGRARLIWRDGLLRAFTTEGPMLDVKSDAPARRVGYLRSWIANTAMGPITISAKCMTCGGPKWWRILRMDIDELWSLDDG